MSLSPKPGDKTSNDTWDRSEKSPVVEWQAGLLPPRNPDTGTGSGTGDPALGGTLRHHRLVMLNTF